MLNLYALFMLAGDNPLLRFEPGLMIWTVIIFVVLLIVLRKFAWGPLLAALDEREQNIKEALEQARKTQRETELVLAENQRRTDEGFKRAEEIVQQARQEAEQMRQRMLEEAKAESRRVTEQGLRRIEAEQRAAMEEIRKMAGDLAIQAAGRLIQVSLSDQQQREIVDKFLAEVPEKRVH
jgi:F-type H+-transporting ATPase subunit b